MRKRLSLVFFIVMITFMLSSCNVFGKFELTDELLEQNVNVMERKEGFAAEVTSFVLPSNVEVTNDINYRSGFIVVENEFGQKAAWSLVTGNRIIAFDRYRSFHVHVNQYYTQYLVATYDDDSLVVINLWGKVILNRGLYDNYSISMLLRNGKYIEIVEFRKAHETKTSRREFEIDAVAKTRTPVNVTSTDSNFDIEDKMFSLEEWGLPNHKLLFLNDQAFLYKADGTFIRTFHEPNADKFIVLNGKFICQTVTEISSEEKKFSYYDRGKKYIVHTKSVDIVTGKEKQLKNINYIIDDFEPFLNKDGLNEYAHIKYNLIENKILSRISLYAIIDDGGKILTETGLFDLSGLEKLDDGYYLDKYNRVIRDSRLAPIMNLPLSFTPATAEKLFVGSIDGSKGAVDYSGNIIIPFEYLVLHSQFRNGKTIGTGEDGTNYFVNADGARDEIKEEVFDLGYGLFAFVGEKNILGTYTTHIKTVDGEILQTLELNSPNEIYNFAELDNNLVYGKYRVFLVPENNETRFIVIDFTSK